MKTRKELLVELVAGLLMSPKQGTIRQHVEEAQQPKMIEHRGHDSGCESNRELVERAEGES